MNRTFLTILIALVLCLAYPAGVWASCTYQTIFINGQMVTCTTCCSPDGRNCYTTCL
jgi:hypothetical protein